jgi:hypothetical protein
VQSLQAQTRKVMNRPYIDQRILHYGFLAGVHMQDIELVNNGFTDEMGNQWFADVPNYEPGFSVGVLADLRLSDHLNLRITPTMHFGAKHLTFHNLTDLDSEGFPHEETQDMKNTYISFPVDLKFSAQRWNNYRPYLIAGVNPMINLTGKDQDFIQLKRMDTFLEVGLGCDLYLPFFKLIPELKFCYSLTNALDRNHANELMDVNKRTYANAVTSGHSKMIVLTFYFE